MSELRDMCLKHQLGVPHRLSEGVWTECSIQDSIEYFENNLKDESRDLQYYELSKILILIIIELRIYDIKKNHC